MYRKILLLVLSFSMWPMLTSAVTRDNFLVRNTQDFVELCTTPESDPMHAAALGFCYGFGLGAFHYYRASTAGPEGRPFICLPEPTPSRTEALQMFLSWVRQNPQHMNEPAVDTLFRWLKAVWPCQK
jgi:Rap1a immunity proteins